MVRCAADFGVLRAGAGCWVLGAGCLAPGGSNRPISELDQIGLLNQIGKLDQINQTGQLDQIDKLSQIDQIDKISEFKQIGHLQ